ncbi:MAG: ergothioneine biosynthesis protein EgtB [Flavobacteriaceae bacterium]|nr:ergothioneine biosynthesis protein EgtB [Flavobacteriaceae bacterium]
MLFNSVRQETEAICQPLSNEDYSVQPVVFVSPVKWHLAHSTWFFEQFVLTQFQENYQVFNADFAYLFNSYYNNAGDRVLRANRGLMTRPSVQLVYDYRAYVTKHVTELLKQNQNTEIQNLVIIGVNHEQQHQELLAYDIKYILGNQPFFPEFNCTYHLSEENKKEGFLAIGEGVYTIGHQDDSFCFDNELGVHKVYLHSYSIANRLVTNAEYIEFIESGGYSDFNLWHAEGWDFIQQNNITAPLYWHKVKGEWYYYNYNGLTKVILALPVCHVSYYEAFAFAEWKGLRLPTEFEWEVASDQLNWGQLWEWTSSAYLPYPNYKKADGALGEYNGKFMVNQYVLRGASVATPHQHSRKTYRNFFHPNLKWMFSGIRLAQ